MMENTTNAGVTRDVILDLLPLYLADEVSADTRRLVECYLETDPQIAEMVENATATGLPADIPIPLTTEEKMKAYNEAKRQLTLRTLIIATTIAFVTLACLGSAVLVWLGAARALL